MNIIEIDYLLKKCNEYEDKLLKPCKYKIIANSIIKTTTLEEFILEYSLFKEEYKEFHIFAIEQRKTDDIEELKAIAIYNLIEQLIEELKIDHKR